MAVLRTPLMRRALGAALLLASCTVLAQSPATPVPSATAAPVPPASANGAQKSAPTTPAATDRAEKSAPSATAPLAKDPAEKSAPGAAAPRTDRAEKSAPAVVPASADGAQKSAPGASADGAGKAAPPVTPSATVLPTPADGASKASESVVPQPTLAPETPTATRQKAPEEEPRWEDPSIDAAATATEAEAEPESMGWMLIRTLLVLGAVVASIYLTLNVGLRRLMGLQGTAPGKQTVVSVVERLTLDPKRVLFVVKAADEYLLLGGGEAGLQLLSKLDLEAVERIRAQRPQTNVVPLSPFLQKLLSRRSGGSSSQPPGA